MQEQRIVYATMVADLFHRGHADFIRKAKAQGTFLIIGLHPDDVVASYKRKPIMPYADRKIILEGMRDVDMVVEDGKDVRSPTMQENLDRFNPHVLVHGTDWLPELYKTFRENGRYEVFQVPSYPNISTTELITNIISHKKVLLPKQAVIVSAGDAITAKLVEEAGFDGIWVSGFEASARLGLPDNGSITMYEMLGVTGPIVKAVKLPVIVDVDTGYGCANNFIRTVEAFEALGCAGICVEDNPTLKTNSLFGGKCELAPMKEFGNKIKAGIKTKNSSNFKIIARTEALIRGFGLLEAIKRAKHYVKCGADMILVHSRDPSGLQVRAITKAWTLDGYPDIPLIIVPTKFPEITCNTLFSYGYSAVVLANQTERIKIKAIRDALKLVKLYDCVKPLEDGLSATLEDLKNLAPLK